MDTMKAAFVSSYGDASAALEVIDTPRPTLKAGEVLVEVEAFGLNFADVLARKGLYREAPGVPFIPGYDIVGRVVEVADSENENRIGQRVIAFTRFGGYAQFVATPAIATANVLEDLPAHAAVALATQYCTAYYASHIITNVLPGERVLVHSAAGGVGSALIQLCKARGAFVYGTVSSDRKAEIAREMGADHVLNYKQSDYAQSLSQHLKGARIDLSFNAVAGSTFKKDLKLLGSGGRMILYGAAERTQYAKGRWGVMRLLMKMGLVLPILLMAKSRSLMGVNMLKIADHKPHLIQQCMESLVTMLKDGELQIPKGNTYPIDKLHEQHSLLEEGKTTHKIAIRW